MLLIAKQLEAFSYLFFLNSFITFEFFAVLIVFFNLFFNFMCPYHYFFTVIIFFSTSLLCLHNLPAPLDYFQLRICKIFPTLF